VLECIAGSAPPAVFASRRHLATHLAILVEFRLCGHTALAARQATAELWMSTVRSLSATLAILSLLATFFHGSFVEGSLVDPPPLLLLIDTAAATGLSGDTLTTLHARCVAACRSYGAVWCVFCNLSLCGDGLSLALLALGFEPTTLNRSPLTASLSPIDFWSRRWNLVIKGLFHRTIFRPLRERGLPTPIASLSAFAVSGLIHEYIAAPASGGRHLGSNMLFFMCQAAACSVEALLARRGVRVLPARTLGGLRAALTTALLLPTAFLFMAPLQAGNLLEEMLMLVPRLVVEPLTIRG